MAKSGWHAQTAKRAMEKAHLEVARRMARFSAAEYEATKLAPEMIRVMAGIALDPTVAVDVRLQAANMVVERSDGKVATKIQVQQVQSDLSGTALAHESKAAFDEAAVLEEAERWISSGRPVEQWPPHIQARFGVEALRRFEGTEEDQGVIEGEAESVPG